MSTAPAELRDRTKAFAIRIVKLYRSLPHTADSQVVGKQLLRCGTSVAANYRAACRGRSRVDWVAKNGLPRLVWSSKRPMKQCFGSKCSPTVILFRPNGARIF